MPLNETKNPKVPWLKQE